MRQMRARRWPAGAIALAVAAMLTWLGAGSAAGADAGPREALRAATEPLVIVALFDRPGEPWLAGHRGVDLASAVGAQVFSPGPGVVTFAGGVAGRGVVVVRHDSGLVTSLEPVSATVRVGDRVAAGQPLGVVEGGAWHCASACVHWGVRSDGEYLNPLDVLAGFGPIRLLPLG